MTLKHVESNDRKFGAPNWNLHIWCKIIVSASIREPSFETWGIRAATDNNDDDNNEDNDRKFRIA